MLTKEQVKQNQEKYGFNELAEGRKKSIPGIFLEQFRDFLVVILIIAAAVSGLLGDGESAAVIFIVITINAVLGTVQTVKAEQSLNSLKQLSAEGSFFQKYFQEALQFFPSRFSYRFLLPGSFPGHR